MGPIARELTARNRSAHREHTLGHYPFPVRDCEVCPVAWQATRRFEFEPLRGTRSMLVRAGGLDAGLLAQVLAEERLSAMRVNDFADGKQGGAVMRRRVRRSPGRALHWDARPAHPRRPSHSSTTNLGGSIGSPVMTAVQGRHPRLRLSRSRQPHQGRLRRPPGRLRRALTRRRPPQGFAPARTTGRTRCSVSTSSCRPRN